MPDASTRNAAGLRRASRRRRKATSSIFARSARTGAPELEPGRLPVAGRARGLHVVGRAADVEVVREHVEVLHAVLRRRHGRLRPGGLGLRAAEGEARPRLGPPAGTRARSKDARASMDPLRPHQHLVDGREGRRPGTARLAVELASASPWSAGRRPDSSPSSCEPGGVDVHREERRVTERSSASRASPPGAAGGFMIAAGAASWPSAPSHRTRRRRRRRRTGRGRPRGPGSAAGGGRRPGAWWRHPSAGRPGDRAGWAKRGGRCGTRGRMRGRVGAEHGGGAVRDVARSRGSSRSCSSPAAPVRPRRRPSPSAPADGSRSWPPRSVDDESFARAP